MSKTKARARANQNDYVCFYELIKKIAKDKGPIKFVIEDDFGNKHHIKITEGKGFVEGKEIGDTKMRMYISKLPADFERLFIEATSPFYPRGEVAMKLTLAKLADLSAKYNQTITVQMPKGQVKNAIDIWREGKEMAFRVNGERVQNEEAMAFVNKDHGLFLVNMKAGIKTARKRAEGISTYNYNAKPKREEEDGKSRVENGKLIVDTDSFLNKKKQETKMSSKHKRKIKQIKDAILKSGPTNKGYVDNNDWEVKQNAKRKPN